jgi:serine/threonine protein kinase
MNLRSILVRGGRLPEEVARPIFRELVQVLQHLHVRSICHCSVSPASVLFWNGYVRLTDFSQCEFGQRSTARPPLVYLPAEAVRAQESDGRSLDLWAASAVLFEASSAGAARPTSGAELTLMKEFSSALAELLRGVFSSTTPLTEY